MKEQIFISYKRVDKERVFAIKDFIEQNTGAKCWIDLDGIESNAQFADKIGTAIDNCQVFIFMRSNAHNTITNLAKDWTYREVNYALEEDKNIIVINLDQSPMPKWFKMLFPNKQEIDATNSDMLNRLCDDLCSWLGILKPIAEPDSESQKTAKRDALPKEPFLVGNLMYKASGNGGVSVCGCDESLKEVHIPAKVEYRGYTYDVDSIGDSAFLWCSSLTSITIHEWVTNIGDKAFSDCESLTTITIPNSITSIGDSAFFGCESLTSITIPERVTNIGRDAFCGCSGLTSIIVEKGNEKYDSRENCNAIIETETNTLIRGCKNTIIPNSVTSIGDWAFNECSVLSSIIIPNSVTSIGKAAFTNCSSLTSIVIPNSVTSIGDTAFDGCSGLTSISIPDSVTNIEWGAFSGCSGLTSIIVAKRNEKYDSRENCNAIIETETNTLISGCKNTIIPNSVTTIGVCAFWGCSGLTSITIPVRVTSIGEMAFAGCKGLSSITIPDGVTSFGDATFYRCESLTSITIPEGVTNIGRETFRRCKSLTSITIPDSVTSIEDCAFSGCISLKKITIPNQLTSIGRDAIPEHTRVRKRGSFWPF